MEYDAYDALLHYVFKHTQADGWLKPIEEKHAAGVCLRVDPGHFRVFPYENLHLVPFEAAVRVLNPVVAVKLRSAAINAALANTPDDADAIFVDVDTRIQVLETMADLAEADKEQCAAFIRDERIMVTWADDIDTIIPLSQDFQAKLIKLAWRARPTPAQRPHTPQTPIRAGSPVGLPGGGADAGGVYGVYGGNGNGGGSGPPSSATAGSIGTLPYENGYTPVNGAGGGEGVGAGGWQPKRKDGQPNMWIDEKTALEAAAAKANAKAKGKPKSKSKTGGNNNKNKKPNGQSRWWSWRTSAAAPASATDSGSGVDEKGDVEKGGDEEDEEEGEEEQERRMRMIAPVYGGLGAALAIFFIGSSFNILMRESLLDGTYVRFALLATSPLYLCLSLFFALQLITSISYVFGPVAQYHENSLYYSGVPPKANPVVDRALPHITVQLPVYKESLEQVLAPTILSLKKAMQTYARQGGTSNIFVNDDGLLTLPASASSANDNSSTTYPPTSSSLLPLHSTNSSAAPSTSNLVLPGGVSVVSEREKRIQFYLDHGIGVVARPKQGEGASQGTVGEKKKGKKGKGENDKNDGGVSAGFNRAGRFKKASNMNYGLDLSLRMEKILARLIEEGEVGGAAPNAISGAGAGILHGPSAFDRQAKRGSAATGGSANPSIQFGTSPYLTPSVPPSPSEDRFGLGLGGGLPKTLEERALEMAVEELEAECGGQWKPWVCNARSVRVGEIILLVDSDTIVPEDCFRDAARELAESPEVAIIQHESDVMQVAHHYFENGIAHFTRRIHKCISMGCANGEVAPFVGHNAFLRWSALQDAAFIDPADGARKIWSETNVSEDFDMALRLQLRGYIIRWATYAMGGFKEGVSLTVDDELNRWQKYAYGCNELIFNPIKDWWKVGPISKQLRLFLWSPAPVHYKITMCSYMFSYYGIAAAAFLALLNYLFLGLSNDGVDGFYLHSFEIWLACTVVFPGAGTVGFTLLEYRLGQRGILDAAMENIMWIPFFFFFFGGMSIHLSGAILAHLFSININWGATKKEVERSNFFIEVPKIMKRFWPVFSMSFLAIVGMVLFTTPIVPLGWRTPGFEWAIILPLAIVAGCHILFPIILNPWLMKVSY